MNVLFVVPYVPNLIRVRSYNLLRHLSVRGHRLTLLTVWANEREREEVEQLKPYCHRVQAVCLPRWRSWWNCLCALPDSTPLQAVYSWHPELTMRLAEASREADVVHIEHLRGVRYGLYLKSHLANHSRRPPIVWDSVDSISLLFRQAAERSKRRLSRWLTRFELRRTEQYEGQLVNQFERVLVTSPTDKEALLSLSSFAKRLPLITVLPNGVDLEYFAPNPRIVREPATLVMSGKMSYHANVTMLLHFVKDILPRIWSRRPDVRLCVVGKDPPREVQALADNPAIAVTGTVKDVRPYLQRASIAVAPVAYGVGIQNKVLEAMACATPVVATPSAVSALRVQPGQDVLVAHEPQAFADTVWHLLEDPQQRLRVGQAGRRYVETQHPWTAIVAQLEEVYNEVLSARF